MTQKKKILLVEDDRELQNLYRIRFEKDGFDVVCAGDGEEGVIKALEENPDLILMDLMLPKQGGIMAMRIIKSNPYTKDIPILVLTAYDHFDYRKDSSPHTIGFMLKTVYSPQKIVETVKNYLGHKDIPLY